MRQYIKKKNIFFFYSLQSIRGNLTFMDPLEEETIYCQSCSKALIVNEEEEEDQGVITVSYMSVIQQVTQVMN